MTIAEKVQASIDNAKAGASKLTPEILDYPGFTSHFNKRFFNNLGKYFDNYFEVGIHKGSTFVAALSHNLTNGIGLDNWSQFDEGGLSKKMAYNSCKKWLRPEQYRLIEADYYKLDELYKSGELKLSNVDLYFFDGEHSYESQKWGITHFVPKLKKGCLVIIDDASWEDVRLGTYDGIKEAGLEIEYERFLWDEKQEGLFWNGLFLFTFK